MGNFYLSNKDSIETNVQKIIDLVIELEMQNGLDLEEIKIKYTSGWCGHLANLVKHMLLVSTGQKVGLATIDLNIRQSCAQATAEHVYVTYKDANSPRGKFPPDKIYVDILGAHHSRDYDTFTSDPFLSNEELKMKYRVSSPDVRAKWDEDFLKIQQQIAHMVEEMISSM